MKRHHRHKKDGTPKKLRIGMVYYSRLGYRFMRVLSVGRNGGSWGFKAEPVTPR